MAAHASVSRAIVLCTGAVIDRRAARVAEATRALWWRLSLPLIEQNEAQALMAQAQAQNRALLGGPGVSAVALPSRSALLGLGRGRALWRAELRWLAVPGLISDRVVEELLMVPADDAQTKRALLVEDGANVQASAAILSRLAQSWEVQTMARVPVVAMSVNPTSVAGYAIDPHELMDALSWEGSPWCFDPKG